MFYCGRGVRFGGAVNLDDDQFAVLASWELVERFSGGRGITDTRNHGGIGSCNVRSDKASFNACNGESAMKSRRMQFFPYLCWRR